MKLSALLLAATFGLASAAPVRIIMISTSTGAVPQPAGLSAIRFGHAAASATSLPAPINVGHHTGCGLKAKMDRMSAKMREAFGLAPIPIGYPATGTPASNFVAAAKPTGIPSDFVHIMPHPHHHRPKPSSDFSFRLHKALNELTPWEGRAISFVVGCGIGVLLRMFFVLAVLLVRARRSHNQPEQTGAIFLPANEVIFVAPPEYAEEHVQAHPVDEKQPLQDAKPTPVA